MPGATLRTRPNREVSDWTRPRGRRGLRGARELLHAQGYAATTVAQVGRRALVSLPWSRRSSGRGRTTRPVAPPPPACVSSPPTSGATGELRTDLDDDTVADLIWSTNAVEHYQILERRGWTAERYGSVLLDLWSHALLAR